MSLIDRIFDNARCKKHENTNIRCSDCYEVFQNLLILHHNVFTYDEVMRGLSKK